ncbi:MAG TPA: hypothetical protein VKM55_23730 [Candidatus Lokiarchaeia archaeon]|nr:hypothetical protein [Candidatus Lokiarchaeia archaeon]
MSEEDEEQGTSDEVTDEDKQEIEDLGLTEESQAGFERLMEHNKPNEPETKKKKFIGFK